MARFEHNQSTTVGLSDVSITGWGVGGTVTEGLVATTRAGGRTATRIDAALADLERDAADRFVQRAQFTVAVDPHSRGTRGGGGVDRPAVRFRVESSAGEHPIAIVDVDGFQYIVRPDADGQFEIPVDDESAPSRGVTQIVGRFAVRVVGILARKAAAAGAEHLVRSIEEQRRPYRLRTFAPGDHLHGEAGEAAPGVFGQGPSLLLLHGFNSAAHNAFRFDSDYLRSLHDRYDGRVAAFDHPSLCHSPRENAEWLANHLEHTAIEQVDILAHSRGGLVARELLDVLGSSGAVRSIVFVATPNNGSPLADEQHVGDFVSMAANLTTVLPDNPVTEAIGIGLEVVRSWVLGVAFEVFSGIACASPGSDVLERLAKHDRGETVFRAVASHYEPRRREGPLRHAFDFVMDRAFRGEANDLLVPTRSTYDKLDRFHIGSDDRLVLDGSFGVSHSGFWSERAVLAQLDQWLDPTIAPDAARPAAAELTDAAADFERATRTGDVALLRQARASSRPEVVRLAATSVGRSLEQAAPRRPDTGGRHVRGTVVVLPGMFGTRLRATLDEGEGDRADLVWPNKWALARGGFTSLRLGGDDEQERPVVPDGLVPEYAPLLTRLAASWDVRPFAFDWRLGIDRLADGLADFLEQEGVDVGDAARPVHVLGHAMGGLVARAYIGRHDADWARGAGRLVQLGTPNWGSFAMVAAALGDDVALRALADIDRVNDEDDVRRTFCSFPSVLQLLPSPRRSPAGSGSDHARLFDDPSWLGPDARRLLEDAAAFRERLDAEPLGEVVGADRCVFVAGDAQETPSAMRIDASGQISFGVTSRGDGRVPHDFAFEGLGIPDDRTFFVEARHGDLAGHTEVLDALDELLATGTTDRLAAEPTTGRRGRSAGSVQWVRSQDLERSLGSPVPSGRRGSGADATVATSSIDLATKHYVGGGATSVGSVPLRVRVVHCSMEQARHAVAAGRYKGIPMEGALAFLNYRLGGALSRLQEFDLFPEDAGEARFVPPADDVTYPKGAIVVGLGEFGQLTSTQLARSIERGAIEYAVASCGGFTSKRTLGISSVLIGTPGRYGLSVQTSIFATVQGVARAAARLRDMGIVIDELELIELYEGKAEEAALGIAELSASNRFAGMDVPIAADSRIDVRPGGRPGSGGYEESGAPWLRLQLRIDDTETRHDEAPAERPTGAADGGAPPKPRSQTLTWTALGRSSQASRLEVQVPTEEIRRHVRTASEVQARTGSANLTLFEMLFPHDAKLELDERDNLHLLVDSSTAWIPWELVTGRDTNGKLLPPLARRAGVLRQLIPDRAERPRRTFRPIGRKALVIGDPPGDPRSFARLPGAREEARIVADTLEHAGFDVTRLIYDSDAEPGPEIAAEIRDAFFAEHYRVIHIAGHGTFDEGSRDPFDNGVVIGPDEVLCAGHFEDRLVTPDLVFLNCCHLGRIDAPDRAEVRRGSYAELAASLSLQLMKIGVRAVVAAGWEVVDQPASTFAETFYSRMVAGTVFGESVGAARDEAFDERNNTWGAYQCYGDPDFQFYRTASRSGVARSTVLSSAHLVKLLRALEMKAGDADTAAYADGIAAQVREIEAEHLEAFETPVVWEAFAAAYSAAGAFDDAVYCYREAVDAEQAGAAIRSVEQLANLESRLAAMLKRDGAPPSARIDDSPGTLCRQAGRRLNHLLAMNETAERWVLRGSLHKRWASIGRKRDDHLRDSRDAYQKAAEIDIEKTGEVSVYHGCLALQLAWLAGRDAFDEGTAESRWAEFEGYRAQLEQRLATLDPNPTEGDFFKRARWIDIRATLIIFDGGLADPTCADEIVEGFRRVFRIRSTARHRRSVIDHYLELGDLLADEDQRNAACRIAERLADG